MFITAIINSMGLTASAAMGIGDKIIGFAFMPQSAFSASSSVIVAQCVGARNLKRAKKSVSVAILLCLAVEVGIFIICQIWPMAMPSLFTRDPEVLELSVQDMKAYSYDCILTVIIFCWGGLLNGAGKTTFNMTQNLISTFLGRIPLTFILSGLPGVNLFILGLAASLSSLMSVVMLGWFILTGRWSRGLYIDDLPADKAEEA